MSENQLKLICCQTERRKGGRHMNVDTHENAFHRPGVWYQFRVAKVVAPHVHLNSLDFTQNVS